MRKITFNTRDFPFASIVERYLDCDDLPHLHDQERFPERLQEGTDQGTTLHQLFYKGMDSEPDFKELFDRLIREVVKPAFDFEFIYQRFPTFRIHQPDNVAVFEFHRDRDYNHHPKEINLFMPMTRAYDTNTFWLESEEGKEDYTPVEAEFGELVIFDGANLRHGNKPNETDHTRVSFDFRILPLADYDEQAQLERASKSKGRRFIVGEYFESL